MSSTSVRPPAAQVLARFSVRDPDSWLTALSWLTVAFSLLQVLLFSFGRDQGIYAMVADAIVHGQLPYRDIWDFKPPGIYLIYAIAQVLFGKSMLAPRLLEVAGLLMVVWCSTRIGEHFFGLKRIGLLGGALALLVHAQLDFWHTAQPESFGGFLTVLGLMLVTLKSRRPWLLWAAIGLVFGCAFLLKPPLGGGALVCAAYVAGEQRAEGASVLSSLKPPAVMALFAVVPTALCVFWFVQTGAFGDLYWTLGKFTPGYTALGWQNQGAAAMFYYALQEAFVRFSALLAFGSLAAFVIPPIHGRERVGTFLILGVISIQLAGIAMQGKFFPYHYGATLLLIAELAGLGLYKLWRRCLAAKLGGVLAFMSFLVVSAIMRTAVRDVPLGFWQRSWERTKYALGGYRFVSRETLDRELYQTADYSLDADRQVARELKERVLPGGTVFVWGFEPVIYWLSERPPATRFIYNVAQRSPWQGQYAREQLASDLARSRPTAIVVQRNDIFPAVTGNYNDSAGALQGFAFLDELISTDYEWVSRIEDFDIYRSANKSSQR